MRRTASLLLVPLLALAAPASTAFASPSATPPSSAEAKAFAERTLADNCDPNGPGMAVLLARGDDVLYRGACGRANIELAVPLSPDQVFRIGSVTKQFAAAAVLKLAEDGKLSLRDPLTKFVPGYPGGDKIDVEMLLNHTSGIRSYTDIAAIIEDGIRKDLSTAALIDTFKDEKPDFAPGEGWHYNNSGYVLVGAVIEAASGKPWHAYLQEAFFAPLGMTRTGYGNEQDAVIPGHVSGYTRKGDAWARARYLSMTQPHAAGALVSTVNDLLTWNRALHEGKVLKPDSYRAMITPVGKAEKSGYGYGIGAATLRGEPLLQHSGGIFGFSSYLLYTPGSDTTVAVLYNADGGRPGKLGTGGIAKAIAAYSLGRPYPAKQAIDVEAATLAQYEGVYRSDAETTRVLRIKDGRATLQHNGGQPQLLIPVAADTFLFEQGFSRLRIERDGEGRVSALRLFPEDEGEGVVAPRSGDPLPAERVAVEVPRAALARVVGEYAKDGLALKVFLDGDTLKGQLAGQPAFELFAESASAFFLKVVEARLVFAPETGAVTAVTLHQGGVEQVFTRK